MKNKLNQNFVLVEEILDPVIQLKFYIFTHKPDINKYDSKEIALAEAQKLFDPEVPSREKKIILSRLAKMNDVEIYRIIEKYKNNPDPKVETWAKLAFIQNHNLIQSHLLDKKYILVTSGLGAKGCKMRFILGLVVTNIQSFNDLQKRIFESEIYSVFENFDIDIEEIMFKDNIAVLKILVNFDFEKMNLVVDSAVKNFIEILTPYKLNLSDKYILTNTRDYKVEEVKDMINAIEQKLDNGTSKYSSHRQLDFTNIEDLDEIINSSDEIDFEMLKRISDDLLLSDDLE